MDIAADIIAVHTVVTSYRYALSSGGDVWYPSSVCSDLLLNVHSANAERPQH